MDIKVIRNAREYAVASWVAGILSFMNAVILFIVSRGLVIVVDLDILVIYFWLLEILLFALSGFALALIAYKKNGQGVPDKKTRNIANIALIFSILGMACAFILISGIFGHRVSYDYGTLDHYLQP